MTCVTPRLAIGQNLFDSAQAEFGGTIMFLAVTRVPRNASLRFRWTY